MKIVSATTPVISKALEHSETTLSIGDFDATKKSVSKVSNKHVSYTKYSNEDRLKIRKYCGENGVAKIRKYCSENGVAMGLRKFKESFPNLNGSTAPTLCSKYKKEIKIADDEEHPAGPIVAQKRGRPFLLESIDHMVQSYLKVSSNCILFDITF